MCVCVCLRVMGSVSEGGRWWVVSEGLISHTHTEQSITQTGGGGGGGGSYSRLCDSQLNNINPIQRKTAAMTPL